MSVRLRRCSVVAAALVGWALLCGPAAAVQPGEMLADPALEKRARELSAELRCLVCQNQSIDDSNAPLARDLRLVVRERLVAGDSNEQVMTYLVQRYGEFILLRPPFRTATLLLWMTPALALAAGLAWLVIAWRRRSRLAVEASTAPLTDAERERLDKLLRSGS